MRRVDRQFRWGIMGTGAVSAKFVAGLAAEPGAVAHLVASRTQSRARDFATRTGVPHAAEGYEAVSSFGPVDAMYIATPPSEHARHALMCIEAGIPVLVEKPFAASASQARQVIDTARRRGVFAMEGLWTRFLPATQALGERIRAGDIGAVRHLSGSFGTSRLITPDQGMFDPALGGGAMAHLGAYPLSLSQWLLGAPTRVEALGTTATTGVDDHVVFQLQHDGGATASFSVSLRSWASDHFEVLGSHGMVRFQGSIVRPSGIRITREDPLGPDALALGRRHRLRQSGAVHQLAQLAGRSSRTPGRAAAHRYAGNGYHYEAREVRRCVEQGLVESEHMPLADSLSVSMTTDLIRAHVRDKRQRSEGS